MPEFYTPLEGEYGYQGEGYTAENGLKLFTKYSVDTARDFIMSELMLTEGKTEFARDLNEFYTFMATAEKLTWEDIEKRELDGFLIKKRFAYLLLIAHLL